MIEHINTSIVVYLKFCSFWPSADAKPMLNDLSACNALTVHVWSIYVSTIISMGRGKVRFKKLSRGGV
jgi:hypothetical protein